MILSNPVNSLSKLTPWFTPLKFGEVKWIVQGHGKVKLDSALKPFTPEPLSASSWSRHWLQCSHNCQRLVHTSFLRAGPGDGISPRTYWGQNAWLWLRSTLLFCCHLNSRNNCQYKKEVPLPMKAPGIPPGTFQPSFVLSDQEFSSTYFYTVELLGKAKRFPQNNPENKDLSGVNNSWSLLLMLFSLMPNAQFTLFLPPCRMHVGCS